MSSLQDDDEMSIVPQEPVRLTGEEARARLTAVLSSPEVPKIEYRCADCSQKVFLMVPWKNAEGREESA
ncbi:hypothetical protein EG328_011884 [Venturia inaequalis]|uniref:Uncharacterized protein n=1 Tax=Venturia inaequalis TaxID=5025 RepID=A0A8H3YLU4_VENIN|nr:hypothetical protein EG328_011884 [Venturia inaequalis]